MSEPMTDSMVPKLHDAATDTVTHSYSCQPSHPPLVFEILNMRTRVVYKLNQDNEYMHCCWNPFILTKPSFT